MNGNKGIEITNVVYNTLGLIDKRIMEHGKRVAFIADEIISDSAYESVVDFSELTMLCLIHDIGAYKTEDVDLLFHFDCHDVAAHSVYGYIFLNHMSPSHAVARAILYHHSKYSVLKNICTKSSLYAQIIHLSDRIDVLNNSHTSDYEKKLNSLEGFFNPELVNIFLTKKNRIISKLKDEKALEKNLKKHRMYLTEDESLDYLKMLVLSLDFKSSYTITHTVTTTTLSIELGKLLGLNQTELKNLYWGALLHDIGKLGVPFHLIEYPGKLTDDEMTTVRKHILYTGEILKGVVNDEIYGIATRHHEKLDGSGYPLKLTVNQLTTSQKIVAVADILSALTEARSYKPPFAKEKTLAIIKELMDNGQLCPKVCELVFENFDMLLSESRKKAAEMHQIYDNMNKEYEEMSRNFENDTILVK